MKSAPLQKRKLQTRLPQPRRKPTRFWKRQRPKRTRCAQKLKSSRLRPKRPPTPRLPASPRSAPTTKRPKTSALPRPKKKTRSCRRRPLTGQPRPTPMLRKRLSAPRRPARKLSKRPTRSSLMARLALRNSSTKHAKPPRQHWKNPLQKPSARCPRHSRRSTC